MIDSLRGFQTVQLLHHLANVYILWRSLAIWMCHFARERGKTIPLNFNLNSFTVRKKDLAAKAPKGTTCLKCLRLGSQLETVEPQNHYQ